GVYMPGVRLVAAAVDPRRRGFSVGAYVASFYFGSSASFFLTGALLGALDWRGAALALAVAAVPAFPLALAGARGIALETGGRARFDLGVLRHGPLMRTITAYAGHSWELFVVRAWLAAFLAAALVARGLDTDEAAAVASLWAAAVLALGIPGVFLGGWISDRLGRRRTALVFAGTSGALSLVFGALLELPFPAIVAIGLVYGGLIAADSAVYSTAVTEVAPSGRVGSAQAVQAFLGFSLGALGPVASGAALDLGLGWIGVFATGGVVGLIATVPLAAARLRAA
ncbi:MAG: MFS transporter, partial [Candidatus Limnocylindria bacterium]